MAKLQTRFCVDIGHQLSELFSVTEKPDGTLNIFHKRPHLQTMNRHAGAAAVLENRTTVHTSEKSKDGGKTFVHTLRLADGRRYRSSAYILPNKYGLTWLLKSVLSQNLDLPIYKSRPKKDDRMIVIDKMNCKRMTLIYHIVVNDNLHYHSIGNINSFHEVFSRFTISLYWLFLAAPSVPYGRDFSLGTSLFTVNGFYTQMDPMVFKGGISLTPSELAHAFNRMNHEFQDDHGRHMKKWLHELGADITPDIEATIRDLSHTVLVRPPLVFAALGDL